MAYNGPCLFLNMEALFAILSWIQPMLIDVFVKHECPRGNESQKRLFYHKRRGQGQKVIDLGVIWRGLFVEYACQIWSPYFKSNDVIRFSFFRRSANILDCMIQSLDYRIIEGLYHAVYKSMCRHIQAMYILYNWNIIDCDCDSKHHTQKKIQ